MVLSVVLAESAGCRLTLMQTFWPADSGTALGRSFVLTVVLAECAGCKLTLTLAFGQPWVATRD